MFARSILVKIYSKCHLYSNHILCDCCICDFCSSSLCSFYYGLTLYKTMSLVETEVEACLHDINRHNMQAVIKRLEGLNSYTRLLVLRKRREKWYDWSHVRGGATLLHEASYSDDTGCLELIRYILTRYNSNAAG